MPTRQVLLVDAFAAEPIAGARTGVVPDGTDLDEEQCQAVASELDAPTTAFVSESDDADRGIRCYSDGGEGPAGARASVAVHHHLFERGRIEDGEHTVAVDGLVRDVEVAPDGTVWLNDGPAELRAGDVSHEMVAEALGIDVASLRDVGADLPLTRARTGRSALVAPVNYFEHVSGIDVDPGALVDICERADVEGLYAFTFDTLDGDATLHARSFDAETGAETTIAGEWAGACAAVVRRHGAVDEEIDPIVAEGGHFLDRPGRVTVDTDGETVRIAGRGVTTLDGSLTVPEPTDDEIIEA